MPSAKTFLKDRNINVCAPHVSGSRMNDEGGVGVGGVGSTGVVINTEEMEESIETIVSTSRHNRYCRRIVLALHSLFGGLRVFLYDICASSCYC